MKLAGSYPDGRRAASMLALQATPYDYDTPEAWGCSPPLIWRTERVEGEYQVRGYTLDELKELA